MATPYKVRVYEKLIWFFNKSMTYITTKKIVDEMGQGYFRTYRALRTLEADGIIIRRSPKSGWRPTIFTSSVYAKLVEIYRRSHQPVPSDAIAIHYNYTQRYIRYHLVELEQAGIVTRQSQRTGWQPTRSTPPPASEIIIDTLQILYDDQPVTTDAIAQQLKISRQHARRLLVYFEQQGLAKRQSQRKGWLPQSA